MGSPSLRAKLRSFAPLAVTVALGRYDAHAPPPVRPLGRSELSADRVECPRARVINEARVRRRAVFEIAR